MKDTITISGHSVGDMSVGIPSAPFFVDTGVSELTKEDREFIEKTIIKGIWELHDNGDVLYEYSDEPEPYSIRFRG